MFIAYYRRKSRGKRAPLSCTILRQVWYALKHSSKSVDQRADYLDTGSFFVLAALEAGLSWYEVESWLDGLKPDEEYTFHLEKASTADMDLRRVWYAKYGIPRGSLLLQKPEQDEKYFLLPSGARIPVYK